MLDLDEPGRRPWYRGPFIIAIASLLMVIAGLWLARYVHHAWQLRNQNIDLERQRAAQRQQFAQPNATPAPIAQTTQPQPAVPDYWTDFRGPQRDGEYKERPILTDWPAGMKPKWKQPIGVGYASFTIGGGRAYTIEQRRSREVVAAYDVRTGREVWTHGWSAEFRESMGGDGPRATPTYHEG